MSLTPPPLKMWHVIVDSPELPKKYEFDLEARVEVEAEVKGAEQALAGVDVIPTAALRKLNQEGRVVAVAHYAEAKPI